MAERLLVGVLDASEQECSLSAPWRAPNTSRCVGGCLLLPTSAVSSNDTRDKCTIQESSNIKFFDTVLVLCFDIPVLSGQGHVEAKDLNSQLWNCKRLRGHIFCPFPGNAGVGSLAGDGLGVVAAL